MIKNIFNGKKKLSFLIIVIVLFAITFGSALLSSTLKIIGNSQIKKTSWIIYFDDIDIAEDSAPNSNSNDNARISKNGVADPTKQNIEFTAHLNDPGDFYEFTVYTVNDGSIDAEVESLEKSVLTEEQQKYLEFDVTYDDGTPIKQCDILYHKDSTEGPNKRLVKAVVKYKTGLDINDYPTDGVDLNLYFKINYSQNINCEKTTEESLYKLTIRPNGGKYEGRTAQVRKYLSEGEEYILSRPTRNLYNFDGWDVIDPDTGGTYHLEPYEDKYKFTMGTEDVIISAKWKDGDYVARIMDHYYTKVELAFDAVDGNNPSTGRSWENNTVWLLKDTEEVALNSATSSFVFNLDGHTLTGKIINPTTGKLILQDGKIQGSTEVEESEKQRRIEEGKTAVPFVNGISGEAVLNYGVLSLGSNDGIVEVDNSIALYGNTYGLYNVSGSKLNFYDGYIDSMDAMTGISSQMRTGDITVPNNYFIFVDHRVNGNDVYQKVYLTPSPNRAVAKTTTVIETYYYNLQDAIETVTETKKTNNTLTDNDYIIEAIRTFEAAYDLNVVDNSRIFIDMKGYGTQIGETVTNNGYLKIYNSKNIDSDVKLSKSIINNGSLEIDNVNIPISTDADGIVNSGSLKLTDVIINSHNGYCVKNIDDGTLDFDKDVVLRSVHKKDDINQDEMVDTYALYNSGNSATINGGTIYGIYNEGTLTLDGENLDIVAFRKYVPNTNNPQYNKAIYNKGNLTMNDGNITFDKQTSMITNIGTFTFNGGTISSQYTAIDNEDGTHRGTLYVKGGEISSENITVTDGTINVEGGTIRTSGTNGIVNATVNVKSGSVVAENGVAIGYSCTASISGGTVTGTTVAVDTTTLNMTGGTINGPIGANVNNASISGGTINGTTNGVVTKNITMEGGTINSSEGIGLTITKEGNITGGEIYGSTYGVLSKDKLTLGSDDGEISSNSPLLEGELFGLYIEGDTTNFYDGILKGQQDGYHGSITGTPLGGVVGEGTENRENNVIYQTDFVTSFEGWLRIGDNPYNTLNAATSDIGENETATIIVTRDADVTFKQELIDANKNKNITLDLNGHRVTTTQNIINNTNLTIIDSSEGTNHYQDTGSGSGTLVILKNDGVVNLGKIIINGGRYESVAEQVFFNKVKDSEVYYTGNFELGIEINKATFSVTNTSVRNGVYENERYKRGYLRVNGIKIESAKDGIYNSEGTIVINGTKDNTTGEYTTDITGTNFGIKNESTLYINGGYIHSDVRAISGSDNYLTVNEIKNINLGDSNQVASTKISSKDDFAIYSYWGDIVINSGNISTTNTTTIVGHHDITVNGGYIIGTRGIKSEEWCSWAMCGYQPITINGGTIIGTTDEGIYSTGTKGYKLIVTGGYILGQTDGIYSRSTATIGTKGGILSTSSPEIRGIEGYGFNNANGELFFYDGIFKGKKKNNYDNASHNGMIRTIEDATMVKRDYEYINNVYYETEYLVTQGDWLEIEGKGKYNTVDKACHAASSGDTIKVIADTHIAFPQTCEPNKILTFDLQDHSVSFTEPITFKSKMTFTGTGALNNIRHDMIILEDDSTILSGTYTSTGGIALTNKKNLTISGGTFETTNKDTIVNSGTITYNDINGTSSITSEEGYAVSNSGTFILKKGTITSHSGIDSNGILTIEDGKVEGLNGYSINARGGTTKILGGEVVNNNGVSVVLTCSGNVTVDGTAKVSSSVTNAITNNGNTASSCTGSNLYIKGGEVIGKTIGITNTNGSYLEVSGGHVLGEETNGININTINAKILGGVIEGGVYGIYTTQNSNYTREVRIGENENNVSVDSPVIKGDSYGLYIDSGTVNFFDGILKGQVDGYYGQISNIADRTELYYDSETIDGIDYDTVYLLVESVIVRNIDKPNGDLSYTEYSNLQDAFSGASNGDRLVMVANAPIYYPVTNNKNIELDMAGYTISTNKKIINNGELVIKNTSSEVSTIKTSSALELITNNNILTLNNINIKNTSASNYVVKNTNKLTLNNSSIESINGVDSNSFLTILNSTITATKNAINNSGKLTITEGTYSGKNYSIYSNSSSSTTIDSVTLNGTYYNYGNNTSTVSNSIITNELQNRDSNLTITNSEFKDSILNNGRLTINDSIYNGLNGDNINNQDGTMNINNSTLNIKSSSGNTSAHFVGITNSKTMNISNTTINHDIDLVDRLHVDTIQNSGTLNIDGTTRIVLGNINKRIGSYTAIRAIGNSSATIDFEEVTITRPNNTTEVVPNIDIVGSSTSYGIYLDSENASVTLSSGYISTSKASTTYGIYINQGEYTQGIYDGIGTSSADVSRENPKIYSAGTTKGIGVKKLNGQFNFYDGIVYGSKYAKPDTTTKVEKNYEVTTYIDNNLGYEYAWLEYMPDDYIGSDLVASITRDLNTTNYTSLTEALQYANPGDEIKLLKSTSESITIGQNDIISLNLNGRSLTGKVTNNGILNIYNGSIQNFEDTTIVNNGELVMGQIEAPVSSTNIRVISEVEAIKQNGTLTMYDGYIEGNPAINGEINTIAEFSRIYTIKDSQSEKIFLQSLDETSIRNKETALLLTIDPLSGYYDGYKGSKTTNVFFEDTVKVKDPIKGGCTFLGWDTTGDITLVPIEENTIDYEQGYRYQFSVGVKDITLTARWQVSDAAVAKIGEEYYESVSDALVEAKDGDKIELLKDVTEENIVNTKEIILDLKGYKLTTDFINNGILRVIDGTIENPNGIGLWNKKTLILGENDVAIPSMDSVKIIGTNIGVKNDGGLKFYDGYIEGEVALVGDVESVPSGYYLYIEHNSEKNCQREYLIGNPQNAVAITKNDSGEESTVQYFFSLQDAIDSASITGKEIFLIKLVPATYPIEVKANKNVVINLNGNNIEVGNTFTNNGTLKLYDTYSDGSHGQIITGNTINNNGTLTIKDINISQTKNDNTINNNGTLNLDNTTITSLDGYAVNDTGILTLNNDINILGNKYSLYTSETDGLTLNIGKFSGIYTDTNLTIGSNVVIEQNSTASDAACIYVHNPDINLLVNNINCTSNNHGIYMDGVSDKLTYKNGNIEAKKYGIYAYNNYEEVTIDNGTIKSNSDYAVRIDGKANNKFASFTFNDGNIIGSKGIYLTYADGVQNSGSIEVISTSTSEYCIYLYNSGSYILNDGSLYALKGSGIYTNGTTFTMNNGNIRLDGSSAKGFISYGTITMNGGNVYTYGKSSEGIGFSSNGSTFNMNGGYIYSKNIGANFPGYSNYNYTKVLNINGGSIIGDVYGIKLTNSNATVNIGNIDEEFDLEDTESNNKFINVPYISGGTYGIYKTSGFMNFYNGRLRGSTYGFNTDFNSMRPSKDMFEELESNTEYSKNKTLSTTSRSTGAVSNYTKQNNGYAKITYIGETNSECTNGSTTSFDYTGLEQTYSAPCSGKYKLEVWGAQGGYARNTSYNGGYGAYSYGEIDLTSGEILYINVGGKGDNSTTYSEDTIISGGYNGGGNGYQKTNDIYCAGGGGATHIATSSGLLSTLSNNKSSVLIVAGGGAGAAADKNNTYYGAHAGGYIGGYTNVFLNAATQTTGYAFGTADTNETTYNHSGAGGGFYGGITATYEEGSGGGSGYIGNNRLSNAVMYGYNVDTNVEGWINNYLVSKQTFLRIGANKNYASFNEADDDIAENSTVEIDVTADADIGEEAILSSNKNITLDLNGHTLNMTQPLYNYANLTIIDSSTNKTGKITNSITDTIITEGNITFNGGTIETTKSNKYAIVVNAENLSINLNEGSKIEGKGGIKIDKVSTTLAVNGVIANVEQYGIYVNAYKSNISVVSGNITSTTSTGIHYNSSSTTVSNRGILNISGGNIVGYNYGVNAATVDVTLSGGEINSTFDGTSYGAINMSTASSLTMTEGTISSSKAYGLKTNAGSTATIDGGTIRSDKYCGYYAYAGTTIINDGTFIGNGTSSSALCTEYGGINITINDGTFTSDNIGIYMKKGSSSSNSGKTFNIYGGTITGSNYGIYQTDNRTTLTIGDSTKSLDINYPRITGNVGLFRDSGVVNFYSGRLRGKTSSYDTQFDTIRSGMAVYDENETVTENNTQVTYINSYLKQREGFLQLDNDTINLYATFEDAISHIPAGGSGTIKVLGSTDYTENITIPNNKSVILDLNDKTLILTKKIVNNSNLTILDNSTNKNGYINNIRTNTIENNGSLTVNNVKLESVETTIEGKSGTGTITLDNTNIVGKTGISFSSSQTLDVTNTDIYGSDNGINISAAKTNITINSGSIVSDTRGLYYGYGSSTASSRSTLVINGGTIDAKTYPLYLNTVNATINGGTITKNSSGNQVITVTSYATLNYEDGNVIGNKQTAMTVSNSSAVANINGGNIESEIDAIVVSNSGTLNVNGGTITSKGKNNSAIKTNVSAATININDGVINSSAYGIYSQYSNSSSNTNKTINIYGGHIFGDIYGVYNADTKTTINIGNSSQNNSVSNPILEGTFYGLNIENGTINYYSGKLIGGTAAYSGEFTTIRENYEINDDYRTTEETINSRTISTDLSSEEPVSDSAKLGNGYARITYIDETVGNCIKDTVTDIPYTGSERTITVSCAGKYKLEVWGAQAGGLYSGYGSYSTGEITLTSGEILYINVGGQGGTTTTTTGATGGYNGGGAGGTSYNSAVGGQGGGGATHIATSSGLLSTLENNKSSVLIVAGGGGATVSKQWNNLQGGHGGGYVGLDGAHTSTNYAFSDGGTQTSGYAFGMGSKGANGISGSYSAEGNGGSGGGWYGGSAILEKDTTYQNIAGAGGSGYIGNSRLSNKYMVGYNASERYPSGKLYEAYLVQSENFITNTTLHRDYSNLQLALDEASDGDVLQASKDITVSYDIVNEESKVTIDLNGFNLKTSKKITVNEELTITNDKANSNSMLYNNITGNLFINNSKLTINNIEVSGDKVIENNNIGTLIINNSTLSSTSTCIKNTGLMTITNSTMSGNTYGIYDNSVNNSNTITNSSISSNSDSLYVYDKGNISLVDTDLSGKLTLNNSQSSVSSDIQNKTNTVINGKISTKGTLSINKTNISVSSNTSGNSENAIDNSGILTITNTTITFTDSGSRSSYERRVIYNSGTITSRGNTYNSVGVPNSSNTKYNYAYGIYNKSIMDSKNDTFNFNNFKRTYGIYNDSSTTATIDNINISVSNISEQDTGIYNKKGNITISGASISSDGGVLSRGIYNVPSNNTISLSDLDIDITNNTNTAYGIYIENGSVSVTTGSIDISSVNAYGVYMLNGEYSQGIFENTGTESVNTSITDPHISAIGSTSGIGITSGDGNFKFYDGYIHGSTSALASGNLIYQTEYRYHPKYLDNGTTCILEYDM